MDCTAELRQTGRLPAPTVRYGHGLREARFTSVRSPDGAFYVLRSVIADNGSRELARDIQTRPGVAVTPGWISIRYAASAATLSYARSHTSIAGGSWRLKAYRQHA